MTTWSRVKFYWMPMPTSVPELNQLHYHCNYHIDSQIILIMITHPQCSPLVGHLVIFILL